MKHHLTETYEHNFEISNIVLASLTSIWSLWGDVARFFVAPRSKGRGGGGGVGSARGARLFSRQINLSVILTYFST